jgi:hypothetical protein
MRRFNCVRSGTWLLLGEDDKICDADETEKKEIKKGVNLATQLRVAEELSSLFTSDELEEALLNID